ncbi:MAG: phosphoribosylanthranilate isomerase [Thermoleophilia bacterium]|nr:phosphoribosylanthranilate isomerase [Thermoleophilia bacterium]
MTLVKICGMTTAEDVDQAVAAGADMIGFILVPWSPRAVDLEQVRSLRTHVPSGVEAVGVLSDETAEQAAAILDKSGLDRIQVYGANADATQELLGERVIVARRLPTEQLGAADPLLLDRAFDGAPEPAQLAEHWATVRALTEAGRRVILASALTVDNVVAAIAAAQPWAVDVARGVEQSPGHKDHARVSAFLAAVREGSAA